MTRREEPIPALSAGLSHIMLTGLFLAVALTAHEPPNRGQSAPEAPAARAPAKASPSSPPPVASAAPSSDTNVAATTVEKEEWPQSDIVLAREQCMHLLSGTSAEIEYLEPVKKGQCGLPAPVLLKSVGTEPKVVFDPPVHVNCRMVSALGKWVKSSLQPEARNRFKSEVVRVVGASGYSCRNIYNRPNARLSQHALANAIDIGAFGLASGRTVRVLKGWGLTARDIKARELAKAEADAKAKAKAASAKTAAAEKQPGKTKAATERRPEKKPAGQVKQASLTLSTGTSSSRDEKPASTGDAPEKDAADPPSKPTREALFLRAIHGGACKEFGTVLGPEANDPHRNHFHLDLIPRRGRGYCQ